MVQEFQHPVCPTDWMWRFADKSKDPGWKTFDESKAVAFDAQPCSLGKQEVAGLTFDREPHPSPGALKMDMACAAKSQGFPLGNLDDSISQ